MKASTKKAWKSLLFRWIIPLYVAWQCGFNMSNNEYLYKYLHEVDLVHHYVKVMHDTHEDDMEWVMFELKNSTKDRWRLIEVRDYAYKLEDRLHIKHTRYSDNWLSGCKDK